mgnify:CR=1 FL=1
MEPTYVDGDVVLVGHGQALRVLASVYLRQAPLFGAQIMLDAGCVSALGHHHGVPCIRAWNVPADGLG